MPDTDTPLFDSTQPDPPTPPADADENLSIAEHEAKYSDQPSAVPAGRDERTQPGDQPEPPAAEPPADDTERGPDGRFKPRKHRAQSHDATPQDLPRIQNLTARLRQAEAERDALRARTQSPSEPPPRTTITAPSPPPADDPEPSQDKYDDFTKYVSDLSRWHARQERKAWEAERAESERQRAVQAEQHRLQSSWSERVNAAKAELPDFEEIALLSDTAIPPGSLIDGWILEHKAGAKVLYHLQKNPSELQDLLSRPLFEQAEGLALLSQKLNGHSSRTAAAGTGSAPAPPITSAPKPPNPVRTGPIRAGDEPPDDDKASIADHERYYQPRRRRG